MKLIRSIVALVGLTFALPLAAQEQTAKSPAKTSTTHADSLEFKLSPELQKSLDDLAEAVQALALRVANDPQLRAAALQVASGFVITAQQVVNEQSAAMQEALKTAAERIASLPPGEKRQPKKTR